MSEKNKALTCVVFQEQLPDLIGSGEDVAHHSHLKSCANCRALLADLECIAAAAHQLFAFEDPPDEIWNGIQMAIEEERAGSHPG